MFNASVFLNDLEETISATKSRVTPEELYQPQFYYALLKANILKLPVDWRSQTQALVLEKKNPELHLISRALGEDLKDSSQDIERAGCYQALLRYTILITSNEQSTRSAGPA